jgi:ATPase subunit of ABC transporter with duplicated ATPase domains
MGNLAVSDLAYAHPGGEPLFSDVSFRLVHGRHAALVGVNGIGKSTLLRILAGELESLDGSVARSGRVAYMSQAGGEGGTVRELLLAAAPSALRGAGQRLLNAERAAAAGDEAAGVEIGEAIGDWSELGGYELEGRWDAASRRIGLGGLDEVADRAASTLSGGERKRLVLAALFESDAEILLLDEPDNFLDIPAKRELESTIRQTRKTVLIVSHDRELLAGASNMVITLEGDGAWVHGESYASYKQAREHRQQLLGDRLERWQREERRLFQYMKTLKERARYYDGWAKRADAAETRWRRFVDAGPPPPPVATHPIRPRLKGGDSARRVILVRETSINELVEPFGEEVYFGERVGLIGPNGAGKTSLMRLLAGADAGADADPTGAVALGNRVSAGLFTQLNRRAEFDGAVVLDVVLARVGGVERAMSALARYELQGTARQLCATLSGGQRARLEILCLELDGHNLLLLDEPTDNLDLDSCEALEHALDGFEGTVVAASHDRAFLRTLDRFLLFRADRRVVPVPDAESAIAQLS